MALSEVVSVCHELLWVVGYCFGVCNARHLVALCAHVGVLLVVVLAFSVLDFGVKSCVVSYSDNAC